MKYFRPEQFWTTLASVVAGGLIVGIVVYGMNPFDNVKKVVMKGDNQNSNNQSG